jgi:hypothetical protein
MANAWCELYLYVSLRLRFIFQAMPWLRWLVAGFSSFRPDFNSVFVRFVVGNGADGAGFPPSVSVFTGQYRVADKSLVRPPSQCILFDGENISFDASLVVYIYIYIYIYIYLYIYI